LEGIIIRKMLPADLPQIDTIEKQCFTLPWSIRSFQYELERSDTILKVAQFNNLIIGYVCIRTILDITHVMNLVVLPEFRRLGIGSTLLSEVLQELRLLKPDLRLITLEVRESNIEAIKLYEKFGFSIIGKRIGYYQNPLEDAVIMGLELKEHE
jgi:ribosomal-protein-alanine N-acetyltransferase